MSNIFKSLIFSAMILGSFAAGAQQPSGKLSGKIVDGSSTVVESATIRLLNSTDSSLVKMGLADKSGIFEIIGLPFGSYLLSVSAVGHEPVLSGPIRIDSLNTKVEWPTIELVPQAKAIGAVTVTSKKPFIEQKAGKIVINVDASPTSAGLSAMELLEKSPGITVDNDGNISVKGKQGVLILIDGKPTYMSGADLANLLKNMQSNAIESVEIMTNPPAKYDAAGNSGIINIKTKKGLVKGMNGNANLGATKGIYGRVNGGVNLNYRNNKVNVFGGYNLGTFEGFNRLVIDRKFYTSDKTLARTIDQVSRPHWQGHWQGVKVGADYYFSKKDVIGIVVNGNFENNDEDPASNSFIREPNGGFISNIRSQSNNSRRGKNYTSNLNYKHNFDSTGREISVDIDYANYNNRSRTLLESTPFNEGGQQVDNTVSLTGNLPSDIRIYSGKIDYTHPLKKGWKLESGLKSSYVQNDNLVNYFRNSNGGWVLDGSSNHFLYNENINAAYAIISGTMKKLEITAGLRVENTNADGKQVSNDSSFTRNYTNLFPNLGLSYNLNDKNQLTLSYSRRVTRPNYGDLNPFRFFLDSLTYGQGNPFLQPQFTNNIEASHTWNRILTTTLNYTRTTDVITDMIKQNTERNESFQTKDNFSKLSQIGIALMANIPVKKWWNANIYVNGYRNSFNGIYGVDPIDLSFVSMVANMTNSFTLPKGWSAEVSGWFRTKSLDGLLVANPMGALNAGVSKQVLQKKGTVKFGVRDILLTQIFSGYARYSDVNVDIRSRRDSRQANLTFSYRFGKTNIAGERKRKTGATDEQGRVGGGN